MDVTEFVSSDENIPSYIDDEDLFCIDDDDLEESLDDWLSRLHANVVC